MPYLLMGVHHGERGNDTPKFGVVGANADCPHIFKNAAQNSSKHGISSETFLGEGSGGRGRKPSPFPSRWTPVLVPTKSSVSASASNGIPAYLLLHHVTV